MALGYVLLYSPRRPRKTVFEHRLVMENHLGRLLSPSEVVHHINGNKADNRIQNLMLFQNNGDHLKYEFKNKQKA
jgi:hypothetical protein